MIKIIPTVKLHPKSCKGKKIPQNNHVVGVQFFDRNKRKVINIKMKSVLFFIFEEYEIFIVFSYPRRGSWFSSSGF